jgi:rRNA maturation endonuclease Nob1
MGKVRVKREPPPRRAQTSGEGPAGSDSAADAGFRPWHFFVLASLMAATAAVVMSRQSTPEHLILVSLTIGAAGLAAAGFYRMLAPLATDDPLVFSEPLTERKRATLEREKTLTLRSIKELEFDRAMGKVSEKDFEEMAGRLRSRALALMKELDEDRSDYRTIIERELDARLARRGGGARTVTTVTTRCAACGSDNDPDAAFCKRCGSRIDHPVAAASAAAAKSPGGER